MSEEMFDVLDAQGNKTGEALPRDEVHAKELWHGVVHVWILNSNNEILMQFRGPDKKLSPSCWDTSVAGHMSADNSKEEAALREIEEEIGITVNADELKEVGFISEQLPFIAGGTHREHEWVFVLRKDLDTSSLKIQKSELEAVKWFSAEELKAMLEMPERRKELSKHADELFQFALDAAKDN